jgi:hypothetical protein
VDTETHNDTASVTDAGTGTDTDTEADVNTGTDTDTDTQENQIFDEMPTLASADVDRYFEMVTYGELLFSTDDSDEEIPGEEVDEFDTTWSIPQVRREIHRVSEDGNYVYYLHQGEGLEVIDISDRSRPSIVQTVRLDGSPLSLIGKDKYIYIALNDTVDAFEDSVLSDLMTTATGAVDVVDISNPKSAAIATHIRVLGVIKAFYWVENLAAPHIIVVSEPVVGECLVSVLAIDTPSGLPAVEDTINLGKVDEWSLDDNRLIVVRNASDGAKLEIIDLSSEDGFILQSDEISLKGFVFASNDLDIEKNVLRIRSQLTEDQQFLSTFNIEEVENPLPVDEAAFGSVDGYLMSFFSADSVFLPSNSVSAPSQLFRIDRDGTITDEALLDLYPNLNGWDNYLQSVLDDTRLISIGVFGEDSGPIMEAVSLYRPDTFDEATFVVDRSSRIYESFKGPLEKEGINALYMADNAVSAGSPDGNLETGIVFYPFGSDFSTEEGKVGAEIYTYSDSSITERGFLDSKFPVSRSFMSSSDTAVTVSPELLSVFDISGLDAPTRVGEVLLARNYRQFYIVNGFGVLILDPNSIEQNADTGTSDKAVANCRMEVIDLGSSISNASPIGSSEILCADFYYPTANGLLATRFTYEEVLFDLMDLSDPQNPVVASSASYPTYIDTGSEIEWPLGFDTYTALSAVVVNDSLVIPDFDDTSYKYNNENGSICFAMYDGTTCMEGAAALDEGCTVLKGRSLCAAMEQDPEFCASDVQECTYLSGQWSDCNEASVDIKSADMICDDNADLSDWMHFSGGFRILDFSNQGEMKLSEHISIGEISLNPGLAPDAYWYLPGRDIKLFAEGNSLLVSYEKPISVADDSKPYRQFFLQEYDLTTPSNPVAYTPKEVPGELVYSQSGKMIFINHMYDESGLIEARLVSAEIDSTDELRITDEFPFPGYMITSTPVTNGDDIYLMPHPSGLSYDWTYSLFHVQLGETFSLSAQYPIDPEIRSIDSISGNHAALSLSGGGRYSSKHLIVDFTDTASPKIESYLSNSQMPIFVVDAAYSLSYGKGVVYLPLK